MPFSFLFFLKYSSSRTHYKNYIPNSDPTEQNIYNSQPKLPSLLRPFDGSVCPLRGVYDYARVDTNDYPHPSEGTGILGNIGMRDNGRAEIFNAVASSDKRSMVFQFNQLMQLYSPEILFNQVQKLDNTQLNVIGAIVNNSNKN